MAHRNIHFFGRGSNRYGADSLIKGVIPVKDLKEMYELQANDKDERLDEVLEAHDNFFECMAILEDKSQEDFLKIVDGESGFVYAEEIWFGVGGTITKAKIGFAEENFDG